MLARTAPGSTVAGVFTQSTTRSASVRDCEAKLAKHAGTAATDGIAILVNSGNANAFTGRDGDASVVEITGQAARELGIPQDSVFSASTGVIGEKLPAGVIGGALDDLVAGLDPVRIEDAARAIMTTDTFPKGSGTSFALGGSQVAVFGFAKGSGHDRTGHGDDAGIRLYGRDCQPGHSAGIGFGDLRPDIQFHHGRR